MRALPREEYANFTEVVRSTPIDDELEGGGAEQPGNPVVEELGENRAADLGAP